MARPRLVLAALVAIGALLLPWTASTRADDAPTLPRFELDAKAGELRLHVKKRGALSAFAHDHDFDARGYTGQVLWDAALPDKSSIALRIPAKELTLDPGELSKKDAKKVQATTLSDDVLDAEKYPEIAFTSLSVVLHAREASGALPLSVTGTLTLHGVSKQRTIDARLVAKNDGSLELSGDHAFLQSDFGIEPYSSMLGAVGVEDELTLHFRLVAKPAAKEKAPAAPATSATPLPEKH